MSGFWWGSKTVWQSHHLDHQLKNVFFCCVGWEDLLLDQAHSCQPCTIWGMELLAQSEWSVLWGQSGEMLQVCCSPGNHPAHPYRSVGVMLTTHVSLWQLNIYWSLYVERSTNHDSVQWCILNRKVVTSKYREDHWRNTYGSVVGILDDHLTCGFQAHHVSDTQLHSSS